MTREKIKRKLTLPLFWDLPTKQVYLCECTSIPSTRTTAGVDTHRNKLAVVTCRQILKCRTVPRIRRTFLVQNRISKEGVHLILEYEFSKRKRGHMVGCVLYMRASSIPLQTCPPPLLHEKFVRIKRERECPCTSMSTHKYSIEYLVFSLKWYSPWDFLVSEIHWKFESLCVFIPTGQATKEANWDSYIYVCPFPLPQIELQPKHVSVHLDKWMDRRTDRQTDRNELIQ